MRNSKNIRTGCDFLELNRNKTLHILTIMIILLSIVVTVTGVFYSTNGKPYDFVNQYGDIVKMYGNGIYAHDSYFKAPIFRGTDFTMLFLSTPLLIFTLIFDLKRNTLKSKMLLASVISVFTYYSASIAFGVTYNNLLLAYIGLFSLSFFGLVVAFLSIDLKKITENLSSQISSKGIYIFLIITGISLFIAWLPDIISAVMAGRSLSLIEVYTTEITYVLDMGIISPVAFISLYLLKKRNGLGLVLLQMLLILCIIIGIMLPVQSIFQVSAGIEIPMPALITKVAIFSLMSIFALFFEIKLIKNIKNE